MWMTSLRPISGSGILADDLGVTGLHHEARCGAPTNFGAALDVIWLHSSTDGDGRLQRLRPAYVLAFSDWGIVPEMDRRSMMMMAGIAAVAAAIPLPEARALPSRPECTGGPGATAHRAAA